jgi:hypothetical protein
MNGIEEYEYFADGAWRIAGALSSPHAAFITAKTIAAVGGRVRT